MGGGLSSQASSRRSVTAHTPGIKMSFSSVRSSSLSEWRDSRPRRLSAMHRLNWFQSKKTEYMDANGEEATARAASIERRLKFLVAKSRNLALAENANELLSKDQLRRFFDENGVRFEPIIFERLYQMMEVNEDGLISVSKLALTFSLLVQSGSVAKDNVELAFRLFDSNQDASIDQQEFQDMVIALVGKRIAHLYEIPAGITFFREFINGEFAGELLEFLDETRASADDLVLRPMTVDEAEKLFETFLEAGTEKQVNVSDEVREACRLALKDARVQEADALVSTEPFAAAQHETVKMIEQGPLLRFKSKLRSERAAFPLAVSAWAQLGLEDNEQMTLEQFRAWASLAPNLFNFLDELQKLVQATESTALDLPSPKEEEDTVIKP